MLVHFFESSDDFSFLAADQHNNVPSIAYHFSDEHRWVLAVCYLVHLGEGGRARHVTARGIAISLYLFYKDNANRCYHHRTDLDDRFSGGTQYIEPKAHTCIDISDTNTVELATTRTTGYGFDDPIVGRGGIRRDQRTPVVRPAFDCPRRRSDAGGGGGSAVGSSVCRGALSWRLRTRRRRAVSPQGTSSKARHVPGICENGINRFARRGAHVAKTELRVVATDDQSRTKTNQNDE